jgi:hypothetical protein
LKNEELPNDLERSFRSIFELLSQNVRKGTYENHLLPALFKSAVFSCEEYQAKIMLMLRQHENTTHNT